MADFIYRLYIKYSFRPGILSLLVNASYLVRSSIYRAIKKNAQEISGVVLDFGSGSKPYEHLFKTDQYIGLDVQQEGHSHEKEQVDVLYDGKNIPFKNDHFDSCFSCQVFEHVFELDHSLREIHRVLKPGGKCLFLVPFVWNEHEIPYDFARYSSFGLVYELKKNGFRIAKQEKDSNFVKVIAQLWCLYLYNTLHTKNKYVNILSSIVLIFPFTLLGLVFSSILPRNESLYFNNVIVAVKEP